MSENLYTRNIGEAYDMVFRQCVSLNTELHKLVPLAKQMHQMQLVRRHEQAVKAMPFEY